MRIVNYYQTKLTADDLTPENGFLAYCSAYFVEAGIEPGSDVKRAMLKELALSELFDEWFEEMVNEHEVHLCDIEGNRILDQFLVSG